MKNRLSTLTVFLAILAVPLAAHAQGKIGVIDANSALAATAEGKKASNDLKQKYIPRQQELQRLQQEMQALQEQLNKAGAALSEEEQARLTRQIEDKQKIYTRSSDDLKTDATADQSEAVRRLSQKMLHVIGEYAQQNGFVLVIDRVQIPVYYAAKDIDITEEIVKRYNDAYPVADAGAPAKPAAHTAPPSPAAQPK